MAAQTLSKTKHALRLTVVSLLLAGVGTASVSAQTLPSPLEILDSLLQLTEPPSPPARIGPPRRAPYVPPQPVARPSEAVAEVQPVEATEDPVDQAIAEPADQPGALVETQPEVAVNEPLDQTPAVPTDPLPQTALPIAPPAPTLPQAEVFEPTEEITIEEAEQPIVVPVPSRAEVETQFAALPDAPCLAQLASLDTAFEAVGTVEGEGLCGINDAVRLSAIGDVELEPAALLTCPTAVRFSQFTQETLPDIAEANIGAAPEQVFVAASYVCRTRNSQTGARLSEHSFGRAIDVRAIAFDDGQVWSVQPLHEIRSHARFQGDLREAACGPFQTVLGPGSDGFHTDHLHFDLAPRGSTYCR